MGTFIGFVEPLIEFVQFAGERLVVSCKMKSGTAGDQEIEQLLPVGEITSLGLGTP